MSTFRKSTMIALPALLVVLSLSACGSSGGDSTSSSTSTGSNQPVNDNPVEGGSAEVPMPPTEPTPGIGVKTPLKELPEEGKTVGWLQCSLPACESFKPGIEAAAKKFGWNVETFVYEPGEPGPAAQQAINKGVDFIAITGQPPAIYEQQVKEAKQAGIPIISANDTTPPEPENGVYTDLGDQSMFGQESEQIAQWMLNDAAGEPIHVAYLTIESYPILESGYQPLEATIAKYCDECSTAKLPVTVEDIAAGNVASKIVAFLQTHPEVNYLDFGFADPLNGVPQVLKNAGLEVTIVGQALGESPVVIEALKKGEVAAWVAQPITYQMWSMVDSMARLATGMPLSEERQAAKQPTWVIDSPDTLKYLEPQLFWEGPPGFEGEFEELWGI